MEIQGDSNLVNISKSYLDSNKTKNLFNSIKEYNISHRNAESDGDEWGKGETRTIGSCVDIKQHDLLLVKNKYKSNFDYLNNC